MERISNLIGWLLILVAPLPASGITSGISADVDALTADFIEGIIEGDDSNSSNEDLPYRLYVPTNYDPSKKYPLVYFFHGLGESGTNNQSQLDGNPDPLIFVNAENRERHPAFMLAPQTPVRRWNDQPRRDQKEALLDRILAEYNIDEDRIYVTGISLGGNSSWDFVNRNSSRIAALLPVCGWGPKNNLDGMPIWNFHADNDGTVLPDRNNGSDPNIEELRADGNSVIYTRYDTGGHAIWDEAYATPLMTEWMFAQRRGQTSMQAPLIEATSIRVDTLLRVEGRVLDARLLATQVNWETNLGTSGFAAGTSLWAADNIPLSAGDNIINVIVSGTDFADSLSGGVTTVNLPISVADYSVPVGDTTAPFLTIHSPVSVDGGFLTDLSSLSLSGTATDDIDIQSVEWNSDRGFSGVANGMESWSITALPLLKGTNNITVTVSDGAGNYAQKFLRVWRNEIPFAAEDTFATYQNTAVDLPVLLNDSDSDESPEIVRLIDVEEPANGEARIYDGVIRYTPDEGFSGIDIFSYEITDGLDAASATVEVIVGNPYPAQQIRQFDQDFESSTVLTDYVDAVAPDSGQLNDISAKPNSGIWSIDEGVLKLTRPETVNSGSNGAGFMRWSDLSPTPRIIRIDFEVGFLNSPNVRNGLVTIDIGEFGDALVDYDSDTPSFRRSARLELAGNTTGRFRFGLEGNRRGDFPSDGSFQQASWFVNTLDEDIAYVAPDGVIRLLDADAQTLFVGEIPLIENVRRRFPNEAPVDIRVRIDNTRSFSLLFDSLRISEVESLPENGAPVVSAGGDQTVILSQGANLKGLLNDDGLPLNSIPSLQWTKISGEDGVLIASPASLETNVSFNDSGVYEFQLSADDGSAVGDDRLIVNVLPDEVYSDWQSSFFSASELTNDTITGSEADPDKDGLSNLAEYALGTNPIAPSSGQGPTVALDNGLSFLFTRIPARTDLTYEVMATSDLSTPWTLIARSVGGLPFEDVDGGTASILENGNGPVNVTIFDSLSNQDLSSARFVQLRVTVSGGD